MNSVGSGFVVDKEFSKSNGLTYFSIQKNKIGVIQIKVFNMLALQIFSM